MMFLIEDFPEPLLPISSTFCFCSLTLVSIAADITLRLGLAASANATPWERKSEDCAVVWLVDVERRDTCAEHGDDMPQASKAGTPH